MLPNGAIINLGKPWRIRQLSLDVHDFSLVVFVVVIACRFHELSVVVVRFQFSGTSVGVCSYF